MRPPASRLLLTSLADFVKESVRGQHFPDPSGAWLECRVFLHGLPSEQEAATYPFVVLRWSAGETASGDPATVTDTVALLCGVYSPRHPAEAGLMLAELLDILRYSLWQKRILASRFQQAGELRCAVPDAERQIHDYHMATIITSWEYVWPSREKIELARLMERA